MPGVEHYREKLRQIKDWEPFLLRESGLPGTRGNIELACAVAEEGDKDLFERLLTFDATIAPVNSPEEFLAFCGVLGQGKLLAQGDKAALARLRRYASDPRWRTREAVAMALQRFGDADLHALLDAMEQWSTGSVWEQRAAAAALCEPRLLGDAGVVRRVLRILDRITAAMATATDRRSEGFQALRKGMGYCWSVAVAVLPDEGKAMMERWLASQDRDIRWVMRENLSKKRLQRMDRAWVERWQARV